MNYPARAPYHRQNRTLAEKRAAFLQVLVFHRTLTGEGFEIAKRTCGLPEREIERMVADERKRRAGR